MNKMNEADILPTQPNIQTAIDISTRSAESSPSKTEDVVTPTNPATKDILDTIIEWVSTPTLSPNNDAKIIDQVEKTTYIDTNDFVMDEKDITKDDNETIQGRSKDNLQKQENSIGHITTKETAKSIVSESNLPKIETHVTFEKQSNSMKSSNDDKYLHSQGRSCQQSLRTQIVVWNASFCFQPMIFELTFLCMLRAFHVLL